MKKSISVIALLLIFSIFTPTIADETDFVENEAYYRELCSGTLESDQRAVCTSFQEYVNSKISNAQSTIEGLSDDILSVENDIAKVDELLQQQQIEIQKAEEEIDYLDASIVVLQDSIEELQNDIEERIKEIEAVDLQIKERLVAEQGNLYSNSIINFLFGGKSYTEIIRRADTVEKINQYNKEQMDWFTSEKLRLSDDQEELERQKLVLEDSLANMLALKESLEVAKAQSEATIAYYQSQVAELTEKQLELQAQQQTSESDLSLIKSAFADLEAREEAARIEAERLEAERRAQEEAARLEAEKNQNNNETPTSPPPLNTGGSWILPVSGGRVSAGAWYYGTGLDGIFGGGVHYGVDFAVPYGTAVYSTGPGIVVYTNAGCPVTGFLGNTCGNYGGNQVITIISMNGSVYALWYAHLTAPYVSIGQMIEYGTLLGTTGSSGNSSGAHLHYEIYYLGDMSISEYLAIWDGSLSFTNAGVSMNLNWTCDVKGAPCRINPQTWHGLSVGQQI